MTVVLEFRRIVQTLKEQIYEHRNWFVADPVSGYTEWKDLRYGNTNDSPNQTYRHQRVTRTRLGRLRR